jgi:c-di-GMP-binding flagellar brake protein YcgR
MPIRAAPGYQTSAEHLTDHVRMSAVLRRLQESHALVTITLSGVKEKYSSSVIKVDPSAGNIWMDELVPAAGHELLLAAARFRATARLHGIEVAFDSRVQSQGQDSGGRYYVIPSPASLHYVQRRAAYRATVAPAISVSVSMALNEKQVLLGDLKDISTGGIRILFPGIVSSLVQPGSIISECAINLPNGEDLICPVQICFVATDGRQAGRMLGARFMNMHARLRQQLEKFVAVLARQSARRILPGLGRRGS